MIRLLSPRPSNRSLTPERKWQALCHAGRVMGLSFLLLLSHPAGLRAQNTPPPAAPAPTATATPTPADDKDQKIISNPFAPGGVTTSGQTISRDEVEKLLSQQELRLKKDLGGGMTQDDISKLVANAAGGAVVRNPDNFIGCVNGVPIYRVDDGTLSLGTKDPEEIKSARCAK